MPRWLARWSLIARRSIPKFVSISPGRSWGVAPIKEHYFSCSKLKEHNFVLVATSTLVLTTKTTMTTATHQKSSKLKLTTCKNQHSHYLNLFLLTPNYFSSHKIMYSNDIFKIQRLCYKDLPELLINVSFIDLLYQVNLAHSVTLIWIVYGIRLAPTVRRVWWELFRNKGSSSQSIVLW